MTSEIGCPRFWALAFVLAAAAPNGFPAAMAQTQRAQSTGAGMSSSPAPGASPSSPMSQPPGDAKPPVPASPPAPAAQDAVPTHPRRYHFSLAGPSPSVWQSRDGGRDHHPELQFPLYARYNFSMRPGLTTFIDSDNVLSTDAFDNAARLGVRTGFEHPLSRRTNLVGTVGFTGSQSGRNQTLGAGLGAIFPLGIRIDGGQPTLAVNAVQYEDRTRYNMQATPRHTVRNAIVPNLGLKMPPLYLGRMHDTTKTAYFSLSTNAYFFPNETALPGYTPRRFEYNYEAGIVLPRAILPLKSPYVQALALTFTAGANPGNNYQAYRNVRLNLVFCDTSHLMNDLKKKVMSEVSGLLKSPEPPATTATATVSTVSSVPVSPSPLGTRSPGAEPTKQ